MASIELVELLNPKPPTVKYSDLQHGVYDVVNIKTVNPEKRSIVLTIRLAMNLYEMFLPTFMERKMTDEVIDQMKKVEGQWQITKTMSGLYWSVKNDVFCGYCNASV